MYFADKFSLTREQSIFLAKKKWDENIYCGLRMENRPVTFPQTQTILQGINVPGVKLDDITSILNMRDAWKFLIGNLDLPVNVRYICKINEYIARNESLEWGKLRAGAVYISGTDYIPPVPEVSAVEEAVKRIVEDNSLTATDKALEYFALGTRGQFFWDGNKRTSMTVANRMLVEAGAGILTVTDKYMEEFNAILLEYYNGGDGGRLKEFLYENCIQGINF